MVFNQAQVLERLLRALELWPPEGWECPWPRAEVMCNLLESLRELDVERLTVLVWVATLLGPIGERV